MKKIVIKVMGRPMTGKTSITQLIENTLKKHGIECTVSGDSEYEDADKSLLLKKLDHISKNTKVEIKQVMLNRDGSESNIG